ncbi:MAG: NAD(P)-dependent oxidoreductase [Phycisphaerales bacterium]
MPSRGTPRQPARADALVIQTEHLDEAAAAWLGERCRLEKCPSDDPRFQNLVREASGLVIRTYTRVDDQLLDRAPKLRVVGRAGVGLDNVDLAACARRGVAVTHTPDANTRAVVEFVFSLLLDITRPRAFLDVALDTDDWKQAREVLKAGRQLCEMTLGIYGMGRIGRQLARAATALNMPVLYHDLLEIPPAERSGATPVSREELARRSDVVSVHVDGRRSNRGLVDDAFLAFCKPEVVLVNTSRGFVVDPVALAEFMIAHRGATALLDVHEPEPFDATYPLLDIENVHLSPHIASATSLAHANMSWVVRDVWRVLNGEAPECPAAPEPA